MDKNEIAKKGVMLFVALSVAVASTALSKTMVTLITDNIIAPTVNTLVDQVVPTA